MADRNFYMRRVLTKIVKNMVSKNPAFKNIRSVEIQFLLKSPVRSAMCDWVYGLKIYVKEGTDTLNVGEKIKNHITRVMSQISNDTFCLTEINFL